MSFDKKAYMREYMARKRASGNKTPKVQTKDLGTDGDLSGGLETTGQRIPMVAQPIQTGSSAPDAQTLSKTDQAFNEDRPSWYVFGDEEKEGNCWKCGKKYTTRLELNRFCGPKCKHEYLDAHFASRN